MSVRMKLTHSKTGSRRAHHGAQLTRVQGTGVGARVRHRVDPSTGMYRGKQILADKAASAKKAAKGAVKKSAPKAAAKKADTKKSEPEK